MQGCLGPDWCRRRAAPTAKYCLCCVQSKARVPGPRLVQEAGGPDGFDDEEEEDNDEGDEMDMLYGENDEDEEFSDATEILQVQNGPHHPQNTGQNPKPELSGPD